jgi:putative addiction module CopG family antidote
MNVFLTSELKASIDRRLRSKRYANAGEVVRAGLRALGREETAAACQKGRTIVAQLPQDNITPKIESRIERAIRAERRAAYKAAA